MSGEATAKATAITTEPVQQDHVELLLSTFVRAFYDDNVIFFTDILLKEKYIRIDDDLKCRLSLQLKTIRATFQFMKDEFLVKCEEIFVADDVVTNEEKRRSDDNDNNNKSRSSRKKKKKTYWYINYNMAVRIIRLRLYLLQQQLKDQLRVSSVSSYDCPRCSSRYNDIDIQYCPIDNQTGLFLCKVCCDNNDNLDNNNNNNNPDNNIASSASSYTLQLKDNTKLAKLATLRLKRLNDQLSPASSSSSHLKGGKDGRQLRNGIFNLLQKVDIILPSNLPSKNIELGVGGPFITSNCGSSLDENGGYTTINVMGKQIQLKVEKNAGFLANQMVAGVAKNKRTTSHDIQRIAATKTYCKEQQAIINIKNNTRTVVKDDNKKKQRTRTKSNDNDNSAAAAAANDDDDDASGHSAKVATTTTVSTVIYGKTYYTTTANTKTRDLTYPDFLTNNIGSITCSRSASDECNGGASGFVADANDEESKKNEEEVTEEAEEEDYRTGEEKAAIDLIVVSGERDAAEQPSKSIEEIKADFQEQYNVEIKHQMTALNLAEETVEFNEEDDDEDDPVDVNIVGSLQDTSVGNDDVLVEFADFYQPSADDDAAYYDTINDSPPKLMPEEEVKNKVTADTTQCLLQSSPSLPSTAASADGTTDKLISKKSNVEKQYDIIQFLKTHRSSGYISPLIIKQGTCINLVVNDEGEETDNDNTTSTRQLVSMLKNNPRVSVLENVVDPVMVESEFYVTTTTLYSYHPKYNYVYDKSTLLEQINRGPTVAVTESTEMSSSASSLKDGDDNANDGNGNVQNRKSGDGVLSNNIRMYGIPMNDLLDTYDKVKDDIESLITSGDVIAILSTVPKKDKILFARNDKFFVELDGIITNTIDCNLHIVQSTVDPTKQIRRGEGICIDGEQWFRVSSATKEGRPLSEQLVRAQAPLSVTSLTDLSKQNDIDGYIRPFTDYQIPLDGPLSNDVMHNLQNVNHATTCMRHGCTNDIRDLYFGTNKLIPESDEEINKLLIEHNLV